MADEKRSWFPVIAIGVTHAVVQLMLIIVVLMASNPHGGEGGAVANAAFVAACVLAIPLAWIGPTLPDAWTGLIGGTFGMVLLFPVNSLVWGLSAEALIRRLARRSR